jgi:beta-xylosidase
MLPHDRGGRLRLLRLARRSLAVLAVVAATTAATPVPPQVPVITRDFPDPNVIAVGNTYWAYSTASGYGTAVRHVPSARSTSMRGTWTDGGDAMPVLPSWVDSARGGSIWAPDVSARSDGTFILYFTGRAKAPQNVQCIGAALATSPKGPFRSVSAKPIVCRPEDVDSIDPKAFTDTDGKQYLLYTSGRNNATIWAQQMSRDGINAVGARRALIVADRPEESHVVEAPTLVRKGGRYVLFYSGNRYNSGAYFTNYATASSIGGPYTKAPGQLLNKSTLGGGFTNPGGQDVVPGSGGHDYFVFHGYSKPGQRSMYVLGLHWSGSTPSLRRDDADLNPNAQPFMRHSDELPQGLSVPAERGEADSP